MFDLSFFKKEGFQVVRSVIPVALIDAIYAFLHSKKELSLQDLKKVLKTEDLVTALNKLVHDPEKIKTYDRPVQMAFSGHFDVDTRLNPLLQSVAHLPEVRALFDAIFPKQKPFMHLPPTARFVLPGNAFAAVPPHQDISYNEQVDDFFVMWVPLCSIDDQRGGVKIFQGTNLNKQFPVGKDQGFWLSGIENLNAKEVHYHMEKGDVLLLNKWIVHASMPNTSDVARLSVDYRFFHGPSKKHALDILENKVLDPQ